MICYLQAHSQSRLPIKIFLNDGTVLEGFSAQSKNPLTEVLFSREKEINKEEFVKYSVNEVGKFIINDSVIFERVYVKMTQYVILDAAVNDSRDLNILFAKKLLSGKANLYGAQLKRAPNSYSTSRNLIPSSQHVNGFQYIVQLSNSTGYVIGKRSDEISLKILFSDCPLLFSSAVTSSPYENIYSIVTAYNSGCSDSALSQDIRHIERRLAWSQDPFSLIKNGPIIFLFGVTGGGSSFSISGSQLYSNSTIATAAVPTGFQNVVGSPSGTGLLWGISARVESGRSSMFRGFFSLGAELRFQSIGSGYNLDTDPLTGNTLAHSIRLTSIDLSFSPKYYFFKSGHTGYSSSLYVKPKLGIGLTSLSQNIYQYYINDEHLFLPEGTFNVSLDAPSYQTFAGVELGKKFGFRKMVFDFSAGYEYFEVHPESFENFGSNLQQESFVRQVNKGGNRWFFSVLFQIPRKNKSISQ